jgi:hypothetical protein
METEESAVELQKKILYDKICPILKLYKDDKMTKIELIEKLTDAFYSLEAESK